MRPDSGQPLAAARAAAPGASNTGRGAYVASPNALTPAQGSSALRMLYAPSEADDPAYRAAIAAVTGGVVDYFDARVGTPSAELLSTYDCVYTWPDYGYLDARLFGDLLGDYVDAGGRVILGLYSLGGGNHMEGKIVRPGYCPVRWLGSFDFVASTSGTDGRGCAYAGAPSFYAAYQEVLAAATGGQVSGHYANGEVAVAQRSDARVFYANGCGASQLGYPIGGWGQLLANIETCAGVAPQIGRGPALLGCTAEGQVFQLDLQTGAGTWTGTASVPAGALDVNDLAYDPGADRIWSHAGDGYPVLAALDPETGAAAAGPVADGASFQALATVGGSLLGASTTQARGPSVLYAPSEADDPAFRSTLASFTNGRVDYFDARLCTPTPELLAQYDVVYTWVNAGYADSTLFGDRLADYVDAGGRVILGAFCTFRRGNYLGGRIMRDEYCPVTSPAGTNHASFQSYAGDGSSCIHAGLGSYAYGTPFRDVLVAQGAGVVDGHYLSDNEIAAAYRADGRVSYLNSGVALPYFSGPWARLLANAVRCGAGSNPPSTLQAIDPATGATTPIGTTGFGPVTGLALDPAGTTLYGVAGNPPTGSRLIRIDPATGAGTLVSDLAFEAGGLAFGPDSALYAGGAASEGGNLYRIALPSGAATLVGASGFASITALARYTRPAITVADIAIPEGQRTSSLAPFDVRLSCPAALPVSVHFGTSDSTATVADGDYDAASGTLTFQPGETRKTVSVVVHGDLVPEPDEVFLLALGAQVHASLATARATCTIVNDDSAVAMARRDLCVTNGSVYTTAISGGTLYLGGTFTQIGPPSGGVVALDPLTGAMGSFPKVAGTAYAVVSDGNGGWFIGGNFSGVDGAPRSNLAHVLADRTVTAWNPAANGIVYALAWDGTTLYAGGDFTAIGGQSRSRIAALDPSTGMATAWDPSASASVRCLAAGNGRVLAAGYFQTIGGASRSRIAALDPATGTATAWNPGADNAVLAMAPNGPTVYVGGDFLNAGGAGRSRVAELDLTTGAATSWNPGADGTVSVLVPTGTVVYAGGAFLNVGGAARGRLAAIDASSGAVTAWNPSASAPVYALAASGSAVMAGGAFTLVGAQSRSRLAALDIASGSLLPWNPGANGTVLALVASAGTIYVGGAFTSTGGAGRSYVAALDGGTGAATSWNPAASSAVVALALDGSTVYAGGQFTSIGSASRSRIAALDAVTGLATTWNPGANGDVACIGIAPGRVYVGGSFTTIGGLARSRVAALDAVTGLASPWNPNANNVVRALAAGPSCVYLGGDFTLVSGVPRNRVACVAPDTAILSAWNPNADGSVRSLALGNGQVFVGGDFSKLGTVSRPRLAALDAGTGGPYAWNPAANGTVRSLLPSGAGVFASGDFTSVGGLPQAFVAFIDQVVLDVPGPASAPIEFALAPPHPNPALGPTTVEYALPRAGHVRLGVFDVQGRRVVTLVDRLQPAGRWSASWSGETAHGAAPAGVYFVRLEADGRQLTRRIVRVR